MEPTTITPAAHQTSWWGVKPETLAAIAHYLAQPMAHGAISPMAEAEEEPRGGVAVLSLSGLITPKPSLMSLLMGGGGGLQAFRANLRGALASDEVASIVLNIDSPGGSTDLVTETAAEVRAARGKKPIVAVANTMAASAAYWIGSQADEFVVTPSGQVGSIGVFALHVDESAGLEQAGIKATLISAGKFKTEGNPFEPLSDDALAAAQGTVDDYYALFVRDVAKGRSVGVDAVRTGFGEGRMVTAKQALSLGMADAVDTFENTVARMARGEKPSGTRAEVVPPNGDKPEPKEPVSEEARARIGRVMAAHPVHPPTKE